MIKKVFLILIVIIIGLATTINAQSNYSNTALVKSIQNGSVIGESTMYVNVSINETKDTLHWIAGDYYGGCYPITNVEVRGNDTTYRCIPNGYREDATFKTFATNDDTYCKLLIRSNMDGYVKFLFAK
jgi:hypothetical protein